MGTYSTNTVAMLRHHFVITVIIIITIIIIVAFLYFNLASSMHTDFDYEITIGWCLGIIIMAL